jgi:hypothetical protein
MSIESIASADLKKRHYTIQPDQIVLLSDLNIRVRSLALRDIPMWMEVHNGSDRCLVVEGLENQGLHPLQKDSTLWIREGWLGVIYIEEQKEDG